MDQTLSTEHLLATVAAKVDLNNPTNTCVGTVTVKWTEDDGRASHVFATRGLKLNQGTHIYG